MSNDDFLLLLQAELDKAASERLINSDIDTIQKDIKHLQVKAEIDDASISKIVEKIKKILSLKVLR